MKITPVQARSDNWMYILCDETTKTAAVIDPYASSKIIEAVGQLDGVKITHLLTTHHHDDHSGGNLDFLKKTKVPCYGGSDKVPGLTNLMKDGDEFTIGDSLQVKCIHTPCHTQDSICYFVSDAKTGEQCVFTGDTLFLGGCGRFFEGTPEEMHSSLSKLMTLPDSTTVYNGHEYTSSSARFGAHIDPHNTAIQRLVEAASQGDTVQKGYTIRDEKEHNVFVRLDSKAVREATGTSDPVEAMKKLREMKNSF